MNRAIVVIAVACWQKFVQDETLAALELTKPTNPSAADAMAYGGLERHVAEAVNDFGTPNAHNSRRLLQGVGFDPRPAWKWTTRQGQNGRTIWNPAMVDARIDEWLKVRHAIAHGHAALPQVDALQVVRFAAGAPPANPMLRLVDAEQCLSFFRRVAKLTETSLAHQLGIPSP